MGELAALPLRDKAPASVNVLRRWITEAARQVGTDEARIQRRIANLVVIAMLNRAQDERGDPLFLVKGDALLELRLGLAARASADLDTLFRGRLEDFLQALDDVLDGVGAVSQQGGRRWRRSKSPAWLSHHAGLV